MTDQVNIWLQNAEITRSAGASLAHSLYGEPLTIWLTGELGAGKTTFLQGFAHALGIKSRLTSPTFALEQRYSTARHGEFLHIDLYRLSANDAIALIASTDDHAGIRCIEWADRHPHRDAAGTITIHLADHPHRAGRALTVHFDDVRIPTDADMETWRKHNALPEIVRRHCDAVANVAKQLGESLLNRGVIVRMSALHAAARTHDLLRPVDFHRGTGHKKHDASDEDLMRWEEMRGEYEGLRHEEAASHFLTEKGFEGIADIVRPHGLTLSSTERITIEQRILYYADKRVKMDETVTLEERLRDFTARYAPDGKLPESENWYEEARQQERDLFPEGPPL